MEYRRQKFFLAAGSVLCAAVAWRFEAYIDGSELSGGWITGPIRQMLDIGLELFLLTAFLPLLFRRIASTIALLACLFCMPMYLLFLVPGPLRWFFKGQWKAPQFSNFVWDWWSVFGIAAVIMTVLASLDSLRAPTEKPCDQKT
jgi:hypothetical protein